MPVYCDPDQGNGSGIKGVFGVEVVAEFTRGHGMHCLVQRAAGKQVVACRFELSRTRPKQGEFELGGPRCAGALR